MLSGLSFSIRPAIPSHNSNLMSSDKFHSWFLLLTVLNMRESSRSIRESKLTPNYRSSNIPVHELFTNFVNGSWTIHRIDSLTVHENGKFVNGSWTPSVRESSRSGKFTKVHDLWMGHLMFANHSRTFMNWWWTVHKRSWTKFVNVHEPFMNVRERFTSNSAGRN